MFSNNPQSFMNGFLSGMRNSIITISLGIAIYGFSRNFKKKSSQKIRRQNTPLPYLDFSSVSVSSSAAFSVITSGATGISSSSSSVLFAAATR